MYNDVSNAKGRIAGDSVIENREQARELIRLGTRQDYADYLMAG